jgi:hypothetical protein
MLTVFTRVYAKTRRYVQIQNYFFIYVGTNYTHMCVCVCKEHF